MTVGWRGGGGAGRPPRRGVGGTMPAGGRYGCGGCGLGYGGGRISGGGRKGEGRAGVTGGGLVVVTVVLRSSSPFSPLCVVCGFSPLMQILLCNFLSTYFH